MIDAGQSDMSLFEEVNKYKFSYLDAWSHNNEIWIRSRP